MTVLAAAMAKPVDVAMVGVVMVGLVSAAAFAVRMRRRRASQPGGGYAEAPGADGGSADQSASVSRGHRRWNDLMGGLEADLDAKRYSSPTTNAQRSTPPGAAAPDRGDRLRVEATRFGGLKSGSAARTPAQPWLFGPDEGVCDTPLLDDDQAVADHSADGPTGSLLALPPAVADHSADGPTGSLLALPPVAPGADGHPASPALERVRACLSAVSTPQVVALSVIDSTGRILAGATDDDVTGELRSLMAESGLGYSADLVQPLRFADDSRGAMLLLPTGANALLGALVRDTDDVQATRARLRGLAHEIGDALRAAS